MVPGNGNNMNNQPSELSVVLRQYRDRILGTAALVLPGVVLLACLQDLDGRIHSAAFERTHSHTFYEQHLFDPTAMHNRVLGQRSKGQKSIRSM